MKAFALRAAERRVRALRDVREVYAYGSFAANCVGPHSDLDLLIVRDTVEPRHRRYDGLALGLDVPVAIDGLVFTPAEFAVLGDRSTFGRTIATTMRRVYAA